MEALDKAIDVAGKLSSQVVPGGPGGNAVTNVVTRNDLTPAVEGLIEWVKDTTRELEAEKVAHGVLQSSSEASRQFIRTVADVYQSVSEGMALKNKTEEHKLAILRTNDIVDTALRAWHEMQGPARQEDA